MKNKALLLHLITGVTVFAGSIDYLSQQDAEYFGNPALTGKIGVSGAYYNPAGTVFMEDGTYFQINNQTHLKTYSMELNGEKFESDEPSVIVPSIQIVHKKGNRSYFFNAGALAGGGGVAYDGGIGTFEYMKDVFGAFGNAQYIRGGEVKGSSYYVALTGGIAQKINSDWSVAAGIRYVNATRTLKGKGDFELNGAPINFDIDSERKGQGVGGIFGLNYHPNDRLNVGFRYETETVLRLSNKEHNLGKNFKNSLYNNPTLNFIDKLKPGALDKIYNLVLENKAVTEWVDGHEKKRNIPAMASLGMSYKVTDKLMVMTSGNYYFIKDTYAGFGAYDNYDNGYEIAAGLNYVLNSKWTLMTGYQYTNTGANSKTYKDTDYALDAHLYGVGAKYSYNPNLDLMGTFAMVFYEDGTSSSTGIKYKKHVNSIGLAAIYKM